jgi:hypothetical protein
MLRSTVALMLATGLSFAFAGTSYAQSCPTNTRFPVVRVIHGVKTCLYSCPAKCHVCQSDTVNEKTGCADSYRCTVGRPGSNDCP